MTLNQFVEVQHLKMEKGIQSLRDLLRPHDWLAKIDLKDAYFNIRNINFSEEKQDYQFTCLLFGLSSAPWIFNKILKPVAALFREHWVRLVDNGGIQRTNII